VAAWALKMPDIGITKIALDISRVITKIGLIIAS
jgi:hypothetical protein